MYASQRFLGKWLQVTKRLEYLVKWKEKLTGRQIHRLYVCISAGSLCIDSICNASFSIDSVAGGGGLGERCKGTRKKRGFCAQDAKSESKKQEIGIPRIR